MVPRLHFATALLLILPCAAQNPPGILYSTTLPNSKGLSGQAQVVAIASDASGNSYVTGSVSSNGLASTPGVVQPSFAGGGSDAFIAKIDSTGSLVFLTYLGGSNSDGGISIAVDSAGHIYVGGRTLSSDFPLAGTPYRPQVSTQAFLYGWTFLAELSADGTTLLWSTVLNETDPRVALAPDGSLYDLAASQVDMDQFVQASRLTKLTSAGQFADQLNVPTDTNAVTAGPDGSVYIGGEAEANEITATPGAWQTTFSGPTDGFVAKVNSSVTGYAWAAYTGGTVGLLAVAPDGQSLWAAGSTTASTSFTSTAGALQSQASPYDNGGFLVRLSADGSQALAATYLPGTLSALASEPSGSLIVSAAYGGIFQATPGAPWPCEQIAPNSIAYFIGTIDPAAQHVLWGTGTSSQPASVTSDNRGNAVAAGDTNSGGISLMALDTTSSAPHLLASCIVPSAGGASGPLAPGELFSIYGADYGPMQGVIAQPSGGMIGTSLGGLQVTVEDTPVPLLYVSAAQINAVAPFLLQGRTAAHIKILTASGTSDEVVLGVREVLPEVFAISNQDGSQNSQTNPAHAGDYLTIWASGMGQTNPPGVDGAIATAAGGTPLASIMLQAATVQSPNLPVPGPTPPPPVNVAVLYAGKAPELVSGVTQINFQLPDLPLPIASSPPVSGPPYAATVTMTVDGIAAPAYIWFEYSPVISPILGTH